MIVLIIFIISCDRFEHNFTSTEVVSFEDFTNDFTNDLYTFLLHDDIESIMNYYSDDYLNNGMNKNDVEDYFQSLSNGISNNLVVTIIGINNDSLKFIYNISDDSTSVDTTIIEYCIKKQDNYKLFGNQLTPQNPQKVLVELITGMWCPNCVYCEEALHDLKEEYGDKFYYIEYHLNDPLDIGALDLFNQYGIDPAAPYTFVQGQIKITGGSSDSKEIFRNILLPLFDVNASVVIDSLNYEIANDSLCGELKIRFEDDINFDNLYLKYVLVEEKTNYTHQFSGDTCRQVVLAKGEHYIGNEDFSESIEFSLSMPDNPPDDLLLYVWVQKITDPYNYNVCKIYNVIKESIIAK